MTEIRADDTGRARTGDSAGAGECQGVFYDRAASMARRVSGSELSVVKCRNSRSVRGESLNSHNAIDHVHQRDV